MQTIAAREHTGSETSVDIGPPLAAVFNVTLGFSEVMFATQRLERNLARACLEAVIVDALGLFVACQHGVVVLARGTHTNQKTLGGILVVITTVCVAAGNLRHVCLALQRLTFVLALTGSFFPFTVGVVGTATQCVVRTHELRVRVDALVGIVVENTVG